MKNFFGLKAIKSSVIYGLFIIGILIIIFPLYIGFVASTHTMEALQQAPIPWWPGKAVIKNYMTVLTTDIAATGDGTVLTMWLNSLVMALLISFGKVFVSVLSAYAIVYFNFPGKKICFWLIFITLMLPVEVRILPTFEVVARLSMLNSYWGLSLPLIASATATFLFRQYFLTLPRELMEAARMDGAGPMRFLWDVVLPLSKTNIAALFVIMFIYGWNQYLWPLVITTEGNMSTIVMAMQRLAAVADQVPQWNYIMATAMLALLPPVIIVVLMQRWFIKGLLEVEK